MTSSNIIVPISQPVLGYLCKWNLTTNSFSFYLNFPRSWRTSSKVKRTLFTLSPFFRLPELPADNSNRDERLPKEADTVLLNYQWNARNLYRNCFLTKFHPENFEYYFEVHLWNQYFKIFTFTFFH